MFHDHERCYRIVQSRDPRFDGCFLTAVRTTGIYCRPSCPARTPKSTNVEFFPTAAAAQLAGYRACKRCRPDASPGSPEWNLRGDVVARAMRLIADGEVDRVGVDGLARRLGYSTRHLNRILTAELGAGPLAIARAQRAQTSRLLIETTSLPFSTVAFAAGFASIRQFNDTVREVFAMTPTELRSRRRASAAAEPGVLHLRLAVRRPFDAAGVFGFLARRALPGIELADDRSYRRELSLPHGSGTVRLSYDARARGGAGATHVDAALRLDDVADLGAAVQRCRRLLDLDADPVAVDDVLGDLGPAGGRVPGAVDGWEMAARAICGQQVSLAGGIAALVRVIERVREQGGAGDGFPAPDVVAGLDPGGLGMPRTRAATLVAVAAAVASGDVELDAGADREESRARLSALPGIGPWTTEYVAMRALADPDAFLPTDVGVRRGLDALGVDDPDGARWRPWRSYAVIRLWGLGSNAAGGNRRTKQHTEQQDADDDGPDDRGAHAVPLGDAEPARHADPRRVGRRPAGRGVARRPGRARAAG